MKAKYLGTAAAEGFPAIYCTCDACKRARQIGGKNLRTRAQMIIDDRLLIDLGPDTCAHAIQYGLDLMQVQHVLMTHSHSDHLYAEDLVFRCEGYGSGGRQYPLTIYGNAKVGETIERTRQLYDDTNSLYQFMQFREVHAFETFDAAGYQVTALPASHDPQEECLVFDIAAPDGARLFYGNDSGPYRPEIMAFLAGKRYDIISLDCTMGASAPCSSHMSLTQCLEMAEQLRVIGAADAHTQIVITHFSHNGRLLHEELCQRAPGLMVAYDGMELTAESTQI